MPYAHEGMISYDLLEGGVEITDQQYAQALAAVLEGQEVTIDGGFAIRDRQPSEHHVWENGKWVDRTPEPEPEPAPPVLPLTARQLRLGLVLGGFSLDQVEATIEAIEGAQDRAIAKIEWEYATQFERGHHLIAQVGAALGISPEQIDSMWEQALTL